MIGDNSFLLRNVEVGSCAGFEPLPNRLEDTRSAGDVALGGANPVLRGQHLKIGVGDAGQCGKRYDIAIEAVSDRDFLRGLQGVAVLAPEIEFITGAQGCLVVDDLAAAIGQAAGTGAGAAGIGLLTGEADIREQRRPGDPCLGVANNTVLFDATIIKSVMA